MRIRVGAKLGKFPVRTKLVLDTSVLDQVSHIFNYLGCEIIYDYDTGVVRKVNKFQSICGTILITLGKKTLK